MPIQIDEDTPFDNVASILARSKRIVIKVGSALVCDEEGLPSTARLSAFANEIARLRNDKTRPREVIVVTSGAVALGRKTLGLTPPLRLDEKQAAAATGQSHLVQAWQNALTPHRLTAAQILLTLDDTENRNRYLNACATLETLLPMPVIPLVNENDTIATAEIRYGDNDRLAAHTAQMLRADLLILLSDIDGLYDTDPRQNPAAAHIGMISSITDDILAKAGGINHQMSVGSGGMITKLEAARIAGQAGIPVLIADGQVDRPISALREQTARASLFVPAIKTTTARRQWIAGRQSPAGMITVDDGAVNALQTGSSLLAAGITNASGDFQRGDLVEVLGPDGSRIALGLCAFDLTDVLKIRGRRSDEIEALLEERRQAIVIHRNDLVLNDATP